MKNQRIDKNSPVPIYFQIAEGIRWQISTAQLKPGEPLLPTREAAKIWGVNRHTIRRAYQELVNWRLIEKQGTSRMIVARSLSIDSGQSSLNAFVEKMCRVAQDRFNLSTIELASVLINQSRPQRKKVTIVECNHYQCFDLKRQLEQRFDVLASEFLLQSDGEPEPGPIVGTLFHFNEICARWPHRRGDMQFGGLYVNPVLADRIVRCAAETKNHRRVFVYSRRHDTDALNLATDLEIALANQAIQIAPRPMHQPFSKVLAQGNIVAVAPWNWDDLSAEQRSHPRCFLLQYCFDPIDIESIGESFCWVDRIRVGSEAR